MQDRDTYILPAMLEAGLVTQTQLDTAAVEAARDRVSVLDALVAQNTITRRQIAITLAEIFECVFVDLAVFEINIRNTSILPRSTAQRLQAFPLFILDGSVCVGMADPLDLSAVDQLRRILKTEIEPVLCEPRELGELIARAYSMNAGDSGAGVSAADSSSLVSGDEPMVAAVNQILGQAVREGASDVHLGPDESALHLRFRVDGSLQARHGPPISAHSGLVQRLKVMAALDLTQTRRPQDGKFRFTTGGRAVDVRLSIIPTIHGENVVMRLLASGQSIQDFGTLGISAGICDDIHSILAQPHGMFLVTGPTGSGKTTTLYTAINRLNSPDRNIMTIEDPVEIRLPLIRQVQVHPEIGLDFAGALRSILRQDPDVVLVGEIRDEETSRIACQAALTGHLVLSTLHTNDAPGAVGRLRDMGCPTFAVNAALLGILAQRLARKTCSHCSTSYVPEEFVLHQFGLDEAHAGFMRGSGCGKCMSTGFRGRIAMTELFRTSSQMRLLIEEEAPMARIRAAAIAEGMKPMWQDGLEKAMLGLTTLEEVGRGAPIDLDEAAPASVRAAA